MKTMTCKQLGGACDVEFHADTFERLAEMSRQHGMEMFQKGDQAHLEAMKKMENLMKSPNEMQLWMEGKTREFDSLPDE